MTSGHAAMRGLFRRLCSLRLLRRGGGWGGRGRDDFTWGGREAKTMADRDRVGVGGLLGRCVGLLFWGGFWRWRDCMVGVDVDVGDG